MTLATNISEARGLCFCYIKNILHQLVIDKTATEREPPKFVFERLKLASNAKESKKKKTVSLEETIFFRAKQQVDKIDLSQLRTQKPQGSAPFLAFQAIFKGEHVVGEGGPYRQFFADISDELQPHISREAYTDQSFDDMPLKLLIPTSNTATRVGNQREKYIFNPSLVKTSELSLFRFLGIMFGACFRTGARFGLDLPSFIWKQIVGQSITLKDIENIDKSLIDSLQAILLMDKVTFENAIFDTFTASMSDGSRVELIPNGESIPVTYERRHEFVKKLLIMRLKEAEMQCNAVRGGIEQIVPIDLLNFFTWNEFESMVCGSQELDEEMLKRNTKYSGNYNENLPLIKMFWEVFHEFSEADKLRFIKFCWGQERLPTNDEEFERNHIRFMIKPTLRDGDQNKFLPKADTCFFNFELPNYLTKEVL
jgi:other hect domain ubiquitin protein ligase E3